jgi:CubicO group peptidase (beta-lactamase class C family)
MQKKGFAFLLTMTCIISSGLCQVARIVNIKGIVTDETTNERLEYASIRLADKGISTMSNAAGQFIFKIAIEKSSFKITVSHIGYKPLTIYIDPSDTTYKLIKMEQEVKQLSEVVVKSINPLDLLKSAIAKIPENYPSKPYRLGGFYRLTGLKGKRVIHLSEAVFDIYDDRILPGNRQFRLIKSRSDKDVTAFNGSDNVEIGLSPKGVMDLDIVGNIKESGILNKQGIKNHEFTYCGLIDYNGQRAYVICFDEKDGIKQSLYRGKIILDADNFAFLEFDIRLSEKGLKYYDWSFGMKLNLSLSRIQARLLFDESKITYQKYGGKYYLNHVNSTEQIYLAGGNKHFMLDPLTNKTVYLVTRIDTSGIEAFHEKEILAGKKSIEGEGKTLNDTRDSPGHSDTTDRFWGNYNLIQADFSVDSAIGVIQSNNASLNLKKILLQTLPGYGKNKITRIDSILNFYYRKKQFNGSALIQYKGQVIYEKGFGMADKELAIPNSGTTAFRIGSTSKQFTAMLIMQLVNQHNISVLDTVGKYLFGYRHGNITIQQLLTHQSGIPNYTANPEYFIQIIGKKYSVNDIVYKFCSDSLEFQPGTQFHYSNSNYVVLADIIEKVSGKNYSVQLRERIFNPLDMKNSYFVTSNGIQETAKGYVNGLPEVPYPVENVTGAGGITSTSEDLLQWANALTSNKLLPKNEMDELFKPRVEWKDWDAYYGYGWMTDRDLFQISQLHVVRYHPGTEFGFFDMLVMQPDNEIVVILLNNTGDFPRFDMTDLILNELDK